MKELVRVSSHISSFKLRDHLCCKSTKTLPVLTELKYVFLLPFDLASLMYSMNGNRGCMLSNIEIHLLPMIIDIFLLNLLYNKMSHFRSKTLCMYPIEYI